MPASGIFMFRPLRRSLVAAAVLAGLALPAQALAPAILLLVQQMVQQSATSMLKDTLLNSIRGMGCKGIALANALTALDARGGARTALGAGLPQLPAGMAMPQLPPGMVMPQLPPGASMPGMPGLPTGAGVSPALMAQMTALMSAGASMPAGTSAVPGQVALPPGLQQAMGRPLSPTETVQTIDALHELGFLPQALQAELKECMVLVPAAVPALGMGMGMMQPMIPQLRQAREQLHALRPSEQDEVADALAQEMRTLGTDERAALMEHLDTGFFPARVSAGVKSRLSAPAR